MRKPTPRSYAKSIGANTYWTGKPCPNGHMAYRRTVNAACVECQRIASSAYYKKNADALRESRVEYVTRNRERIRDKARESHRKNAEARNAKRRKHRNENKEAYLKRERDYIASNREIIRESRREYYRKYMAERREKDPAFKSLTRMRDFVRRCTDGCRGIKNWKTESALGYTAIEFRDHIESLWHDGMSWENYGEWHIDHIRSIKSFLDSGITDIRVINALSNLQPLWAFDNLSKGAG